MLLSFSDYIIRKPSVVLDGGVSPKVWPVNGAINAFLDG